MGGCRRGMRMEGSGRKTMEEERADHMFTGDNNNNNNNDNNKFRIEGSYYVLGTTEC
jgi:hypothetical protein